MRVAMVLVLLAGWFAFFLTQFHVLVYRSGQPNPNLPAETIVTCYYVHATGIRQTQSRTSAPDRFGCPSYRFAESATS